MDEVAMSRMERLEQAQDLLDSVRKETGNDHPAYVDLLNTMDELQRVINWWEKRQ